MESQGTPKQRTSTSGKGLSKRGQTSSQAIKEDPEQSGLTRGGDPKFRTSAPARKK